MALIISRFGRIRTRDTCGSTKLTLDADTLSHLVSCLILLLVAVSDFLYPVNLLLFLLEFVTQDIVRIHSIPNRLSVAYIGHLLSALVRLARR